MRPSPRAIRRCSSTVLWAALVLAAQTLTLAHLHADEAPAAECVICTLAKAEHAACDHSPAAAPEPAVYALVTDPDTARTAAAFRLHHQARAPPAR